MSKLEQLIQEFCPNGVAYSSIGSIISRVRNKGKEDINVTQVYVVSNTQGVVRAEDYRENTIHSEDTSNYTIIRENMVAYNPSRLNIGSIARLKYSEAGLVSPMYVVFSIDSNRVLYEYFDYLIKSSYVSGKIDSLKEEGARFRFDFFRWDLIMVPIPPIPVQKEIVRILDTFRELTVELTAELTARHTQYDYYRDTLFKRFTETKLLNEICDVRDGTHSSPKPQNNGKYLVTSKNVKKGKIDFEGCYFISLDDFEEINKRSQVNQWDLLFTMIGTIGEVALVDGEADYAIKNVGLIKTNDEMLARYLYHFLHTSYVKKYIQENKSKGSQAFLALGKLRTMPVLWPPVEEQEKIVKILDRFELLCNDISTGLPAEIEARQKQYEYYRDKLLTFKELSV